jgi:hypothetical protein
MITNYSGEHLEQEERRQLEQELRDLDLERQVKYLALKISRLQGIYDLKKKELDKRNEGKTLINMIR